MLTLREAFQRLQQYGMRMRRFGTEWMVYYGEDKRVMEHNSYITDDLDDAVNQAAKMRHRRLQSI